MRDPRVGTVTITGVATAPDLSVARVYVHALDEDAAAREELLDGLRAAGSFVRRELGQRLQIRRAPELIWSWDESFQHARRIEDLLSSVRPADRDDDEGDVAD